MRKSTKFVFSQFLDMTLVFLENKAKIKDRIGKRLANDPWRDRFAIAGVGGGKTRYGLDIAPDRIFFE